MLKKLYTTIFPCFSNIPNYVFGFTIFVLLFEYVNMYNNKNVHRSRFFNFFE